MTVTIPPGDTILEMLRRRGEFVEQGETNTLSFNDVSNITSIMAYAGANPFWRKQAFVDLFHSKYRIFDWLMMCINNKPSPGDKLALKVLLYAWLKTGGIPKDFVQDLKETNYNECRDWERVELP
jgi:hypothetical protein